MITYVEFVMVAGDQADALVVQFPTPPVTAPVNGPVVLRWDLSADAPAFGWTLYFAPAAAAVQDDIVVVDSILAADMGTTVVAPHGATQVVNRQSGCHQLVPRAAGTAMGLRVTTSGKVGTGILRVQWDVQTPTSFGVS